MSPASPSQTNAAITPTTVRHLAQLARIDLGPEEVDSLTIDLSSIIASVTKVSEVATSDIPATSHPIPLHNVFRDDVIGETLTIEQTLSGAPESANNRFKVSAILEEEL
jgi:aspartyl-tRNA(Asn)/glutamyl-tRNA(Gln) amidotransferase subunit C